MSRTDLPNENTSPKQLADAYVEMRRQNKMAERRQLLEIGKTLGNWKYRRGQPNFGRSPRALKNYKALSKLLSKLKSEHLIERVQLSKLQHFYEILNEDNVERLVTFCEDHSEREIEKMVKSFPPLVMLNEKKKPKHKTA